MKKTTSIIVILLVFTLLLIGCGREDQQISDIDCEHQYTSNITKEATYESEGEMTYVCEKCGDTYTKSIKKLEKHVVPTSVLDNALSNCKYEMSPFSITVGELVNTAMDGYEIQYLSGEEAIAQGYLSESQIDESVNIDYLYYAIISGDTMINPEIPYMTDYEEEAVEVWMVFDENDRLHNYDVKVCENLNTCAILFMTSF